MQARPRQARPPGLGQRISPGEDPIALVISSLVVETTHGVGSLADSSTAKSPIAAHHANGYHLPDWAFGPNQPQFRPQGPSGGSIESAPLSLPGPPGGHSRSRVRPVQPWWVTRARPRCGWVSPRPDSSELQSSSNWDAFATRPDSR